jgi:NAD(P)H-dependent flavin oxidoreductase YrpB (nitropropane dioxygenase family)
MPLQGLVSEPALKKVDAAASAGHRGAETLATYWVGQAVGLMNEERSVADVMMEFKNEYLEAFQRVERFLVGVGE